MRRIALLLGSWLLLAGSRPGAAQHLPLPPPPTLPAPRVVALDSVAVAPQAADIRGWLLLDRDLQLELDGAVQQLYNFKFDRAEKQFRSLRRRYPQHPLPYFLLALSTWWRLAPYPLNDTRYDQRYYAYLDTAEVKAHALLKADKRNYEACFFLSAAYGYEARLASDRHQWRRATVASRRALNYLQQSREANGLSAEFELGYGLFDYYAVWIGQEYPWLRPVLLFFPKGNRERGLAELRQASQHAFYARTEADYFRVQILTGPREHQAAALPLARRLATAFPDNSLFAVEHARLAFDQGQWQEAEAAAQAILTKCGQGLVGYEARAGRTAAYLLAYLRQHRDDNPAGAEDLYRRCLVFAETAQLTRGGGYYVFAAAALAELAARREDVAAARRYYTLVQEYADRRAPEAGRARAYLRQHPAP